MQATTPVVAVQNTGDAIRASLAAAFSTLMAAIPRIFGFLVILVVGWLIAGLVAKAVAGLLRAVHFNDLAQRSGFAGFVHEMGVRTDSVGVLANLTKWFIRLIALVVAFDALGLPAVSDVLRQLLLWLPNLVVALVVLVIGGLLAKGLGSLVRGATAEAGFRVPDTLATVARVAVMAFAIVVALNQIGVATTLVNTLLIGMVAALALATGIAFGLGGRDKAAQTLERLGRQVAGTGPALAMAGQAAGERAREATADGWRERSGTDRRQAWGPAHS
jgi:hypothetical protein